MLQLLGVYDCMDNIGDFGTNRGQDIELCAFPMGGRYSGNHDRP